MKLIKTLLKLFLYGFLGLMLIGLIMVFLHDPTDSYKDNKESIDAKIKALIEAQDFDAALTIIERYSPYIEELRKLENDTLEQKYLKQLKIIPVEEYEENLGLYKELIKIKPDNSRYKNKIAFYETKINEQRINNDRELAIARAKRLEAIINPPWRLSYSIDKMTDEKQIYISSSRFLSIEPMGFPYGSTESFLGIGCDGKSTWAYIGFSESPNLNSTQTEDGYDVIYTRIRFDDEVKEVKLTQQWSSDFLHAANDEVFINDLKRSNKVRLSLDWHGEGDVYFDYGMNKFDSVYAQFIQECEAL